MSLIELDYFKFRPTFILNRVGVWRNIDLTIRKGQFVVITGRIGSGKTTLLRALLGLVADG